jgi:hypothetical protein
MTMIIEDCEMPSMALDDVKSTMITSLYLLISGEGKWVDVK